MQPVLTKCSPVHYNVSVNLTNHPTHAEAQLIAPSQHGIIEIRFTRYNGSEDRFGAVSAITLPRLEWEAISGDVYERLDKVLSWPGVKTVHRGGKSILYLCADEGPSEKGWPFLW